MTTGTYLISDSREKAVHGFVSELFNSAGAEAVIAQINTGDFLICRRLADGGVHILAALERKTLKDFGASLRDGRHQNFSKMIDLREKTGCRLYCLVEGPAFPSLNRRFSRVPFREILAAMNTLSIQYDIHLIKTPDAVGTAQCLLDFVQIYCASASIGLIGRLAAGSEEENGAGEWNETTKPSRTALCPALPLSLQSGQIKEAAQPSIGCGQANPSPTNSRGIPVVVLGSSDMNDACLASKIWAGLAGITPPTGYAISQATSIVDFVSSTTPLSSILNLRTTTGHPMPRRAVHSLRLLYSGSRTNETRILSGVPGITLATAAQLLKNQRLSTLLSRGEDLLAARAIQYKTRSTPLGPKKARLIVRLMSYDGRVSKEIPVEAASRLSLSATSSRS